jgi:hypothetical protein
MLASRSNSSWDRYSSAFRSFWLCSQACGFAVTWPIPKVVLRKYVDWAVNTKKLASSTIKLYLSDFKTAHKLRDLRTENFSDFFLNSMLKGAENLALYKGITKHARLVMTFALLKILGHAIAVSDWSTNSKRVYWTACCVAFFGSFRMGELLSANEHCIDTETLTWDCVNFTSETSTVIQIKFPKCGKNGNSQFVDLFKIEESEVCPVGCLRKLHSTSQSCVRGNLPVFTFKSGGYLSTHLFTKTLRSLLYPFLGENAKKFSGHSFRAGILAAIANHPSLLSNDDICKWGRWSSNSYQSYTRLKLSARREIYRKLLCAFDLK